MERLDRFEENMRFGSQRIVWQWCSRLLRPAWERQIYGRIDILSGMAPLFGFTSKELHCVGLTIFCGMSFTRELILNAMAVDPATLLYLGLRGIELEDIRECFCVNRPLDGISKLTLARETRYGDAWTDEGLHPGALITEWERAFHPLKEVLTLRFLKQMDPLTDLLAELIPGNEIDEHLDAGYRAMAVSRTRKLRRTPRSLLNLATRWKLRNLVDEARRTMDSDELVEFLLAAIPSPVMAVIERAGHEPLELIGDFLYHDMRFTRESLLALDRSRPRLP